MCLSYVAFLVLVRSSTSFVRSYLFTALTRLPPQVTYAPTAHTQQIFWRGMSDLGLTVEFQLKGGTQFACLSTSASKTIAVNFATSSRQTAGSQARAKRSTSDQQLWIGSPW